ncbi:MAG: FecR family protein [Winogradskyella sp.]
MNRELLIKKWLDQSLNTEEQNAFEQLTDYNELIQLNTALKSFKAPEFSIEDTYKNLQPKLKSTTQKTNWLQPLLKIAAIFVLGFSLFYYTTTLDTEITTTIAEQTHIELPDASKVNLNANSDLTYNKTNWSTKREVQLNGEAFFKVAKGQKFNVITTDGMVGVLGTQFNVKQRHSYFEVTCYEGLVAVTHHNKTINLQPGNTFKFIDGKQVANKKTTATQPTWLIGESNFTNTPLKHVISEFENHYNLKVKVNTEDASRLFTGSFTHKNLDLALQSITIPLNLSYSKSKTSIILKRE